MYCKQCNVSLCNYLWCNNMFYLCKFKGCFKSCNKTRCRQNLCRVLLENRRKEHFRGNPGTPKQKISKLRKGKLKSTIQVYHALHYIRCSLMLLSCIEYNTKYCFYWKELGPLMIQKGNNWSIGLLKFRLWMVLTLNQRCCVLFDELFLTLNLTLLCICFIFPARVLVGQGFWSPWRQHCV